MKIDLVLNGREVTWDIAPGQTLLAALRDHRVYSAKRGCETGDCGSCTVLCDDQPVNTCMVPAAAIHGRRLTTLEGLLGDELMVTLQREMVERGGIQCGYCTPGMLISFYALLKENGCPDDEEIRESLTGNLCRCTGYVKPVDAVMAVVKERDRTGGQAE